MHHRTLQASCVAIVILKRQAPAHTISGVTPKLSCLVYTLLAEKEFRLIITSWETSAPKEISREVCKCLIQAGGGELRVVGRIDMHCILLHLHIVTLN